MCNQAATLRVINEQSAAVKTEKWKSKKQRHRASGWIDVINSTFSVCTEADDERDVILASHHCEVRCSFQSSSGYRGAWRQTRATRIVTPSPARPLQCQFAHFALQFLPSLSRLIFRKLFILQICSVSELPVSGSNCSLLMMTHLPRRSCEKLYDSNRMSPLDPTSPFFSSDLFTEIKTFFWSDKKIVYKYCYTCFESWSWQFESLHDHQMKPCFTHWRKSYKIRNRKKLRKGNLIYMHVI